MPVLADLIHTNVATAGSINDKLIAYFSGIYRGSGSPEGVIDAPLGSTFQDVTTPAIYIKTTAAGTLTGWVAFANGSGGSAVPPVNGKVGAAGTLAFGTGVTGDAQANRFTVSGDGTISWGSGAGAVDVTLFRTAASNLKTGGRFDALRYDATAGQGSAAYGMDGGASYWTWGLNAAGEMGFGWNNSNATVLTNLLIRLKNTNAIGFYGVAPVIQAAAIASPTAPSAAYVQAEAASMKTAVDAIRVALTNIGITL